MRGHDAGVAHRRGETIPHIEIWQQPFLNWLIFRAYHLWEKLTWRALRLVEPYHQDLFRKSEDYVPLTSRQDERCEYFRFKKRVCLAVICVTQEQYNTITGKTRPIAKPRYEAKKPISIQDW